jgi:type IV fimbrial biogenesis protein FimT
VRQRAEVRGFTLIEMMVAIAIAALLLLLAGPPFTTFLRNSEIRSTSESIVNGLRAAKTEAARQNRRVMFTLEGGNSASWVINVVNDPVDCADPVAPPIQSYVKEEAGKNSKVIIAPADKLTVCFDGIGRVVKQGTPNDHIMSIDVESIVACQARPLRIVVDDADRPAPRGLRMCDPNPNLPPDDPRYCNDGNDKSC